MVHMQKNTLISAKTVETPKDSLKLVWKKSHITNLQ